MRRLDAMAAAIALIEATQRRVARGALERLAGTSEMRVDELICVSHAGPGARSSNTIRRPRERAGSVAAELVADRGDDAVLRRLVEIGVHRQADDLVRRAAR